MSLMQLAAHLSSAVQPSADFRVRPVAISWHPALPIYASEPFLRYAGDEYGWLGGFDNSGQLRCFLPYTILQKPFVRMVRFRVETMPVNGELSIDQERNFLNAVMSYFRSTGADLVIPASTNTIFRTTPDGAVAAPYGSYIVDLTETEEMRWNKLHSKHRNVIRSARKNGVQIKMGLEYIDAAYKMIRETLRRSRMGFLSLKSLNRLVSALADNINVFVAECGGVLQGCAIIPYSAHSAYYLYGGSNNQSVPGAMNLLQWEAMRYFSDQGTRRYDFVGTRIAPKKGSKQEGLKMFKERFGGTLARGYIWKYQFCRWKYELYQLAVRRLRGGDIVDQERLELSASSPDVGESSGACTLRL
jgi:hypothetical protein